MERENSELSDEVVEKHNLLQAVNSLVHANQHLQDEVKEYKSLLSVSQERIAIFQRQTEE